MEIGLGGRRESPGDDDHPHDPSPRRVIDETELRRRIRLAGKRARWQLPSAVMIGVATLITLPVVFFRLPWRMIWETIRQPRH